MANRVENFNRADTTPMGIPSGGGPPWDIYTGETWGIYLNGGYCASVAFGYPSVAVLGVAASDVDVQCTFRARYDGAGLCARASNSSNFIGTDIRDSGSVIYKMEGGTRTDLATGSAVTLAHGDVFKLTCFGSNIQLYRNGDLLVSTTSSFNSTATNHGLLCDQAINTQYDDFSIRVLSGVTFDFGINFRDTDIGATDPAGTTYCLNEFYPVARAGNSFGWYNVSGPATPGGTANRTHTDPRLGGIAFALDGTPLRFRFDGLEEGLVTLHLAIGDTDAHGPQSWKVLDSDGTTVLDTVTTGALSASTYFDANGVNHAAADWGDDETGKEYAITGTSIWIEIGSSVGGGDYHTIAHFRAVQVASGALELTRSDNFNRADSFPAELGMPSDGIEAWGSYTGSWGTISNQAGSSSTTNALTVLECGQSDGEISVATYDVVDTGIAFRVTDSDDYCLASIKPSQIALYTSTGGTFSSALGSVYDYTHADGDVVTVVMKGTSVSVRLNGAEIIPPVTITHNSIATQHGLWTYLDSSTRFDNFEFWSEASEAPTALTPGTVSFVKSGPSGVVMIATDATDGTGPYTYQWQRSEDGGSFSDLSGKTTLSLTDDVAIEGVLYGYRLVYTDDVSDTANSNDESAKLYLGGVIASGVFYFAF